MVQHVMLVFLALNGYELSYSQKELSDTILSLTAENLSNILGRNDIKKSDAYQSGFLEGTTPTYEAYMQLKKSIAAWEFIPSRN